MGISNESFRRYYILAWLGTKPSLPHLLSQLFVTTTWPLYISEQVLSNHSIDSSSRTVRPYSPWRGALIGHWRTIWSTVCSSAPHSQITKEAIPHLYKKGRKCLTPVRGVKPEPRYCWEGHIEGDIASVGDESTESKAQRVVRPFLTELVIRPVSRTNIVVVR